MDAEPQQLPSCPTCGVGDSIAKAWGGRVAPPASAPEALAHAAEGFQAWDVLDAAHMLVASLIVDLVADGDRPNLLRRLDKLLRERVKEIGARQKPKLVV